MDVELAAIERALVAHPPSGEEHYFVDIFVLGNVTELNVQRVLELMSQDKALNLAFWSVINSASISEEGWRSIFWIGSDMSDEQQERNRRRLRNAVEIVRATVGDRQVKRALLFQRPP